MSPTLSFQTLGCRLNQSESETLAFAFSSEGYEVVPPSVPADLCVINTCSVTQAAEAKCRALIRNTLRQSPHTFIVVTGCYAQSDLAALCAIPGVDLIAGTAYKMILPQLLKEVGKQPSKRSSPLLFHTRKIGRADFTLPPPSTRAVFDHHTRPNIKIQDGCDFFCSFCIIPYTRGRERSRKVEDVLLEASLWTAQGYKEIVLTGVNLGEYDSGGTRLDDLVLVLESLPALRRIRLSSIEPTTVSPRLLDRMREGKLCPYLHLPLQSGSNRVLQNMGRRYTKEAFQSFVQEAQKVPSLCLGTDVLVGFPGESDADFDETVALIESLPFAYLHIFPFSERKGTRVTRMKLPRISSAVIKNRARLLHRLATIKEATFYNRAVGQSFEVLFEKRNGAGLMEGLTENYLRVEVAASEALSGEIRPVRIEAVCEAPQPGHYQAIGTLQA